jgi:translation initiation factor IF-3
VNQDYRVNERIKASMVRLVLASGEHVGIVSREDAIERAVQEGMDLVEISPEANPPVCKLLDYGKFKYRRKKRLRQKHHKSQVKEIWIGPETAEHDLGFKAGRVQAFLREHHKVRVTMRLTGRHKAHGPLALEHMRIFGERFAEAAKVEQPPKRESSGRVSMLLSPK